MGRVGFPRPTGGFPRPTALSYTVRIYNKITKRNGLELFPTQYKI